MVPVGLILVAVCIPGLATVKGSTTPADCKAGALAQHNYLRSMHQVPGLVWNDTLATAAQEWAVHLASGPDCASMVEVNIAYTESTLRVPPDHNWTSPCSYATLLWYSGGVDWNWDAGTKTDNLALLGQQPLGYNFMYTIWAATTQLGCGAAQGLNGCWSVVCRYSPPVPAPQVTVTEASYWENVANPVLRDNMSSTDSCNAGLLQAYDSYRSAYQAAALSWDNMLTIAAQAWADELAQNGCQQQASGAAVQEDVLTWPSQLSSAPCAAFADVAYRGASVYKFTSKPWTDNAAQSSQVGAFINMVSTATTRIGCGRAQGADGCWASVCWYGDTQTWTDSSLLASVGLPVVTSATEQSPCQQAASDQINLYRAGHGVSLLSWNSSFAALSQGLAASAANANCNISWLSTANGLEGYTTAASDTNAVCIQAVTSLYTAGNSTFNMTAKPWTDNKAKFDKWRSFTQMIWQNTTQVGCGSAEGPDGCWVVICKYDPPGNTQTDAAFLQNVLPFQGLPSDYFNKSSTSSSGGHSATIAIIAGVCSAAGAALALVVGYLLWRWRKQQQKHGDADSTWYKTGSELSRVVTADTNTTTINTGYSMPSDGASTQRATSHMSRTASSAAQGMMIPGLVEGDPFTRGTAYAYSWNSRYMPAPDKIQSVEAGVNDAQLDAMVQGSNGQVQDCPVVCLTKEQVKQQLQLLTHGLRGRGGAALVFKALWPSRFGPDALLAVKVLKDGYDADLYVLESFAHEASVLETVRHRNVVRLYGYCLDPPNVCLIMELLPCSLKELLYDTQDTLTSTYGLGLSKMLMTSPSLASVPSQSQAPTQQDMGNDHMILSMAQVLHISTEIAAGLAYLHDQQVLKSYDSRILPDLEEVADETVDVEQGQITPQKIVHRDLKPANILINSQGHVKISDFGLARWHNSTTIETRHIGAGTIPYQAPEILSGSHAYGIKATNRCDVYSMAIMFWEMLARQPPWKNMNEVVILSQVVSGRRPELPAQDIARSYDDVSQEAEDSCLDLTQLPASLTALPAYNDIIRQCWAQREGRRPRAAEAHRLLLELQHRYQLADMADTEPV